MSIMESVNSAAAELAMRPMVAQLLPATKLRLARKWLAEMPHAEQKEVCLEILKAFHDANNFGAMFDVLTQLELRLGTRA